MQPFSPRCLPDKWRLAGIKSFVPDDSCSTLSKISFKNSFGQMPPERLKSPFPALNFSCMQNIRSLKVVRNDYWLQDGKRVRERKGGGSSWLFPSRGSSSERATEYCGVWIDVTGILLPESNLSFFLWCSLSALRQNTRREKLEIFAVQMTWVLIKDLFKTRYTFSIAAMLKTQWIFLVFVYSISLEGLACVVFLGTQYFWIFGVRCEAA